MFLSVFLSLSLGINIHDQKSVQWDGIGHFSELKVLYGALK